MHITEKISNEMNAPFKSIECSDIRKIEFSLDHSTKIVCVQITFVYSHEQELLTLRFINITEFCLEKEEAGRFSLGELLFYDQEDDSPLIIGDELGGFYIACDDVKFVNIEPIYWR